MIPLTFLQKLSNGQRMVDGSSSMWTRRAFSESHIRRNSARLSKAPYSPHLLTFDLQIDLVSFRMLLLQGWQATLPWWMHCPLFNVLAVTTKLVR